MNVPIRRLNIRFNPQEGNPYEALMKGFPGIVSAYLLNLNMEGFPYVSVFAADRRRLHLQPRELIGKPYNWHAISPAIGGPRARAIEAFIREGAASTAYDYKYWDKGALWKFACQLIRLPPNYLLLVVADAEPWQKYYWESSAQPLESLNDDDFDDESDDDTGLTC